MPSWEATEAQTPRRCPSNARWSRSRMRQTPNRIPWDNQYMDVGLWGDVPERDGQFVLVHDIGGDLTPYDHPEDGVVFPDQPRLITALHSSSVICSDSSTIMTGMVPSMR